MASEAAVICGAGGSPPLAHGHSSPVQVAQLHSLLGFISRKASHIATLILRLWRPGGCTECLHQVGHSLVHQAGPNGSVEPAISLPMQTAIGNGKWWYLLSPILLVVFKGAENSPTEPLWRWKESSGVFRGAGAAA